MDLGGMKNFDWICVGMAVDIFEEMQGKCYDCPAGNRIYWCDDEYGICHGKYLCSACEGICVGKKCSSGRGLGARAGDGNGVWRAGSDSGGCAGGRDWKSFAEGNPKFVSFP